MKFFNDLWQFKKAELAFMAEHWGIYLILGLVKKRGDVFVFVNGRGRYSKPFCNTAK